ncbi:MAG TPA: HAD family hydrolase [Thermoanaerobaculia bacterium]|nr:HAD family hydrolase [Thermoanaerobaculia bacterium]
MTTKPTAILFDLDGVLIDATEWHYESLNRALALFGFSINRYEHLSAYNGLPTRTKLEMLSVEKGLPRALHPLIKRLKQVYTKEEILSKCWPVFEKEYMLSRLRREGYTLAVCSNAIRETMTLMLERSGVLKYFELVLSNEDVDRPKPDPEIYLKAMERLQVKPEQVLIIEDAPHGIEAARRSGARVLEVAGFHEVDYWKLAPALEVGSC